MDTVPIETSGSVDAGNPARPLSEPSIEYSFEVEVHPEGPVRSDGRH